MSSVLCPTPNTVTGSSCKRRICPTCGERWCRDWLRCLRVNLEAYNGPIALVSLTPPGRELLPWDEEHCSTRCTCGHDAFLHDAHGHCDSSSCGCQGYRKVRHTAEHGHNGKRGCRAQQRQAREWCETLSWRWAKLRTAAVNYTRRHVGIGPTLLGRAWEPQTRGVVHGHPVLGCKTAKEREAARVFLAKLAQLAPDYGFGFSKPSPMPTRRMKKDELARLPAVEAAKYVRLELKTPEVAARYLAGYLTGRSRHKPSIRETVTDPAMTYLSGDFYAKGRKFKRSRLAFVWLSTRLTKDTFCTMRFLRRCRHLWAVAHGYCDVHPQWGGQVEAVKVAALYRRIYRRRDGPPADLAGALSTAALMDESIKRHWWTRSDQQREITRYAFLMTRPSEPEAVAA